MDRENPSCSDTGITDGLNIVSYLADDNGGRRLVAGSMWQPVNIVNDQAWREIERRIALSRAKIASGRVSRLHYFMTAHQMDTGLLAKYTGQFRWLVRLHMFPLVFGRLGTATLKKYAALFNVSLDALLQGKLEAPVCPASEKGRRPVR
jgi:hypothetical protein